MKETGIKKKKAKQKTQTMNGQAAKKRDAGKKLAEMNLLDDFLFGAVVTYPEIGERFVKGLLKIIFGKEFKHLSVTAQKVLYGADINMHGARLDVYLEPEIEDGSGETATVYDIEPDRNDSEADRKALPRRLRFYHGKIVAKSLSSGAGYDELKNVVIIMIMPYDPFGLGRMVYTIKSKCVEVPDMHYEDGASTLFLYTKGTEGVSDEALGQLLHYMEVTTYENAVSEELRAMHEMVETVKKDPEVTIRYMRWVEVINRSLEKGIEEGRAKGIAEGEFQRLVFQICKKMKKDKTLEVIAEELEESVSVIEPIYITAQNFAPEYDPKLVLEKINMNWEK